MRIGYGGNFLPLSGGTLSDSITFTAGGIKWSDFKIIRGAATIGAVMNLAGANYEDWEADNLRFHTALSARGNAAQLNALNVDNCILIMQARDNGNTLVEVARLAGAADAYFQATLPMRLNPSAEPGTLVEGHFWYDSTSKSLRYRDNSQTNEIQSGAKTIAKVKTADETVNNSSVYQNDDHLFFAMGANEVWRVRIFAIYISTAEADFRATLSLPAGAIGYIEARYLNNSLEETHSYGPAGIIVAGSLSSENKMTLLAEYTIINGANAGNCQLQWAQGTAQVSDTKLLAGSNLIATRVS